MQKDIFVHPSGKLLFGDREYTCALGRGGVRKEKREGDGATPAGCFPIRKVFYRADRVQKPNTALPVEELKENDGWCDDSDDENYNKHVKLPYNASYENLWREDEIYDLIVILGFNDDPPEPGKGSAVFMHIARPEFAPTVGCIALVREDLMEILEGIEENTQVCIKNE